MEIKFEPERVVELTPWKFFIGLLCCFVAPFLIGLFYGAEIFTAPRKFFGL